MNRFGLPVQASRGVSCSDAFVFCGNQILAVASRIWAKAGDWKASLFSSSIAIAPKAVLSFTLDL
tara:strand:- start:118949 stop:119143 length:195 start_codon:yes stop_codon:yes gene_type:complete